MANSVAALLHGRDNNFNLIRFVAASLVLLDHAFYLVAREIAAQSSIDFAELEVGRLGVDAFFIVSGFLVTRSVVTQPTLIDYAVARFLRLFPALLVVTAATAFLLGPLVTTEGWRDYFGDARPWIYVPLTASLITHSLTLPGVFETVPEPGLINPPLWTLRYEVMCYVLLALFALLGMFGSKTRAAFTLALVLAGYLCITFLTPLRSEFGFVDSATRFVLGFFAGGALYLFGDRIKLSLVGVFVLAVTAFATYGTPLYEMALRAAMAYGLIWFALVPGGAIRKFNLLGDYSYGLYILCFPIMQTIVMLYPAISPWPLFFASFPAVLALAVLSWHFIEHPALMRKAWAGDCVGSLLNGVRDRLAASFGGSGAAKALK
jgi:peptidoglycan/LPS O-acetylase OafA/YrhL